MEPLNIVRADSSWRKKRRKKRRKHEEGRNERNGEGDDGTVDEGKYRGRVESMISASHVHRRAESRSDLLPRHLEKKLRCRKTSPGKRGAERETEKGKLQSAIA